MSAETTVELLARIVAAYEDFTRAELAFGAGASKPDALEAARSTLRDRVEDARRALGTKGRQ